MDILQFTLQAHLDNNIDNRNNFINLCNGVIDNITSSKNTVFKLKTCVTELVTNVFQHAYADHSGFISCNIQKNDTSITLEILDNGKGINFSDLQFDIIKNNFQWPPLNSIGLDVLKNLSNDFSISDISPNGTSIKLTINI